MQNRWSLFLCCLYTFAQAAEPNPLTDPPLLSHEINLSIPTQSNDCTYVKCLLNGQLGNQLFQIATALAYAWDYNAVPIFSELDRTDFRISYNRDRIFFRLNTDSCPRPLESIFKESSWCSSTRIPFQKDLILHGYFCSWSHFDHHRDKILNVFAPSQTVLDYLNTKYGDLINNPKTVSLHVRTFTAGYHRVKHHHFLGMEYYRKAISQFPEDTVFVVFSDRINWCKYHFQDVGRNFIFIEGNDGIEDLFLMSMMKSHIIANSSYSWWAAYMNQNPDKIVVAPQSWHHPDLRIFPPPQPNEFYFDDWIVVTPDYSEPYPLDMTWFDAFSQSIDAN